MLQVINKYKIDNPKNPYAPITIGYCERCNTEVSKSQYGEDEECPYCKERLNWQVN